MANNKSFQQIDVFGLFNALYTKGSAKLSDHFINEDPGTAGDSSGDLEK